MTSKKQPACLEDGCECIGFEQIGKLPRCSKCFHSKESHTVISTAQHPVNVIPKEVTRLNSTGRPLPTPNGSSAILVTRKEPPSSGTSSPSLVRPKRESSSTLPNTNSSSNLTTTTTKQRHAPPQAPPPTVPPPPATATTIIQPTSPQKPLPQPSPPTKPLPKPFPTTPNTKTTVTTSNSNDNTLSRRDQVAKEILTTERTFVELLQLAIEEFLLPLRKSEPPILSQEKVTVIFSNIAEVLQTNTVLLEGLEQRVSNWGPKQLLGDLFSQLAPFLKIYTSYVANFEVASSTLEACEKIPAFEAFLKERIEDPKFKGQNLRSFLILPVQRIPRYRLLLEDLVKSTDSTHPDYPSLVESLETIKVVAAQINDAVKKQENRQKILSIQSKITSLMCNLNLVEAHRLFIREGVLWKQCRKAQKKRLFYLFNDLLLYASQLPTNALLVHRVISLSELRIADIPDTGELQNAFQIGTVKKSFVVSAETKEQKVDWLIDITNTANELKQKNLSLRRSAQQISEADEAPVWQPDSAAKQCFLCKNDFSLLNRRHHCRNCGKVVCSDCSKQKLALQMDPNPQRVCDVCWNKHQQSQQSQS